MNPGMQQAAERAHPGRLDSLWVGLSFLLLYEILRQSTIYGDGVWILHLGSSYVVTSPVHLLYLPLLRALRWLLDPLGASVFGITSHLSCVATAAGIGSAHRAFRVMRLPRKDAVLAASLVGLTPGIVFYATVVEWQPLFFGLAGLAFVAAARMSELPTPGCAVQLGLSTGVAYLAHASGVILPLPLLLMAWVLIVANGRWISVSRCVALTGAAGLAHATVVWGVPALLRALSASVLTSVGHAQDMFSAYATTDRWQHLTAVLGTIWNEWVLAFMPMSAVCIAGVFVRRTRWMAIALAVSLIPYLTVSVFMLAGHGEHGAYLLPLAFPAAWITLRACPRPLVFTCAIAAAATAVTMVKQYDDPQRSLDYAGGLRAVAEGQPMAVLIGEYEDLEACFVRLPEVPYVHLADIAQHERSVVEASLPLLDARLDQWLAEGRRVFVTDRVEGVVAARQFEKYENVALILEHLRGRYELTPVAQGTFSGKELHRR